jgi:peptide methionine sulfoxide reductase MsrB
VAKELPDEQIRTTDHDDDAVRCLVCDHRITERAYGILRSEAHEHTFVNPHGIVHTIGCYSSAPGCMHVGPIVDAFSWFPGFAWQVALCERCQTHLGWVFRCNAEQFHGLILAALKM